MSSLLRGFGHEMDAMDHGLDGGIVWLTPFSFTFLSAPPFPVLSEAQFMKADRKTDCSTDRLLVYSECGSAPYQQHNDILS